MQHFMLITSFVTLFINLCSEIANCEITTISLSGQDELMELLHTEKVLIDSLRHFIETQDQNLNKLKRKTEKLQDMHDSIGEDWEKYVKNPINSIRTLKRFTSDWKELTMQANKFLATEAFTLNLTQQKQQLAFPTEDDYESALGNLLLIQDMFKLETQHLSIGEVNGVKLGSAMSWSDCLEIGLRSFKKGYQTYAKYWMETALDKLPNIPITTTTNANAELRGKTQGKPTATPKRDEYSVKARIEVLRALLNMEYKIGNLDKALNIAKEMLELNPNQKNVLKAVKQMEDVKKEKQKFDSKKIEEHKPQIEKTDEELLIEDICRETTNNQQQQHQHHFSQFPTVSHQTNCILTTQNLNWLMLQPLQVELLSLDPFIVIYHNVLSDTQSKVLKDFVAANDDDDDDDDNDENDNSCTLQLTKVGKKNLHQFSEKLHYVTGHGSDVLTAINWQVNRYNFENLMKVSTTSMENHKDGKRQAGLLFHMQKPLLGGSIIFPQLDLSIDLPNRSLLYWSTLNEFGIDDYRTKYHVCPVIAGTQMTATSYVGLL